MKCNLCGNKKIRKIFNLRILNKYDVDYYQCCDCGYIFTEEAYWLNEAYDESIAITDTGYMQRNVDFVIKTNSLIKKYFDSSANFLDYGGGYGIFVRMMRDCGYNFLWADKYSENMLSKGFEYNNEKIELVTAFELFEHFQKPNEEFERLLKYSKNILLSTTIYSEKTDVPDKDWYFLTPETGQHISFYSKKSFEYLANRYNLNYYMISDNIHLFTKKNINSKKVRFYFNNKIGILYDYYRWIKARKSKYCMDDSQKLISKMAKEDNK